MNILNHLKQNKGGFTLIEILLVITILGVLASIAFVSLEGARASARDTERKAETDSVRKALAIYYTEHGQYPESSEWVSLEEDAAADGPFSQALAEWLPEMPQDPRWGEVKESGEPYTYQYSSGNTGGSAYRIHAEMESNTYAYHETYSSGGEGIIYNFPPVAEFVGAPIEGGVSLTVFFTDTSTSSDGITAWEWDFNNDDVIDSTAQDPMYTYSEVGTYTTKLTVREADGDNDTEIKTGYITVEPTSWRDTPDDLTVVESGIDYVTLSWHDGFWAAVFVPNVGYYVYIGLESGVYFDKVDVLQERTHTFNDLMPDTDYYFAVTVYNEIDEETDYSNEVSAFTSF